MSRKTPQPDPLRAEAGARLARVAANEAPPLPVETLLHQLRGHQIELEMQNEALRQSQIELEESRDRYANLYEFAPMGYLTLTHNGLIAEINLAGATLLGDARQKLINARFDRFVSPASRDHWYRQLLSFFQSAERQSTEITLQRQNGAVLDAHLDSLRVVSESDNALPMVRIALTDISAHKRVEAQLRTMAIKLAMTEERERRAIAQDLHDDLGQTLAIAKLRLTSLETMSSRRTSGKCELHDHMKRHLEEIETMIDQANRSVRSLSMQLSPPVLHQLGLIAALEWLADKMQRTYGLVVQVNDDGKPKPLDEGLSYSLFRIVRELLINVSKHAKVSEADVFVSSDNDCLMITVADAGIGFDPKQLTTPSTEGGFGLFGVRERINFIGGTMKIDSRPGDGTVVELNLPLKTRNETK